jgi:UDP-glucose:(heptosyl)LPS alpha-1,3-glucosyltransferase
MPQRRHPVHNLSEMSLHGASPNARRLRIAFVVHDYSRTKGHSRYVVELASRFCQEHEVHVFANQVDAEIAGPIRFHRVPAWRVSALATILTFAIPARVALSMRGTFDIVHIQGFCGPHGNVITSHICNEAWYQGLLRTQSGVALRERIFRFFTAGLERRLYARAHGSCVIAISKRVAHDLSDLYDCRAPIKVIHHGVDLERFSPETCGRLRKDIRDHLRISESETVFAFVGNLRKGAEQCIRALSLIDSGLLIFASESDPSQYRILAKRAGCSDRVRFLGATSEIEKVFAAADALVLPTPYDSFALVCTEAMACGLPVVISRNAGASELISPGQNGIVLEDPGNYQELAHHMNYLRSDRWRAARMGRIARDSIEHLSWDTVAERTMAVYHNVVDQSRS